MLELSDNEIIELRNLIAKNKTKKPKKTLEELFWIHTLKGDMEDNIEECWNWVGAKDESGYGTLSFEGRKIRAHRLSWEIYYNQKVPKDRIICHHCDNPSCVNPNHLYCGTYKDNYDDMIERGRAYDANKPFKNIRPLPTLVIIKAVEFKTLKLKRGEKIIIAKGLRISMKTLNDIWNANYYPSTAGYLIDLRTKEIKRKMSKSK